jgi:hypothetical protein
METKEKAQFEALYMQYLTWKSSQQDQTDGYEFEKSFIDFCSEFNKSLFELSIEINSGEKKSYHNLWRSYSKERPLFGK